MFTAPSITGRVGWPFGAPYATSKHGLEGLSESLRRELMLFGVDVVIVAPCGFGLDGAVEHAGLALPHLPDTAAVWVRSSPSATRSIPASCRTSR